MNLSNRIDQLPPYLFVEISRTKSKLKAEGIDVIDFGIGDPDMPTPSHIVDQLVSAANIPANHRYPETDGLPALREAISTWYSNRFSVQLDQNSEVLPLIGAKEGIGHMALCLIDPGDIALVPDPGYPVYSIGTMFAGGEVYWMPLLEKNDWLPDLANIPTNTAKKAKCIWINYPNNPTGAIAPDNFFKDVIEFARAHNIVVLHDAAYSEVTFDGYRPPSFLQFDGAKEVGIEFNSLSKAYNMTGWRVGMAAGNADLINALFRVKSNLDSGIPQAIQEMSIKALTGPNDSVVENNRIYQIRRDKVVNALIQLGLTVYNPHASLYVWAKVPHGYTSIDFATQLLNDKAIVVTQGSGYGQFGEGYIRLSLTIPDSQLDKGIDRLNNWSIPSRNGV